MCKALGETSRLIDTTLNRVSIRLGGILRYQADDDFLAKPSCASEAPPME